MMTIGRSEEILLPLCGCEWVNASSGTDLSGVVSGEVPLNGCVCVLYLVLFFVFYLIFPCPFLYILWASWVVATASAAYALRR